MPPVEDVLDEGRSGVRTRLILLEGAPATGKSTAAAALHRRIAGSNLYTEFGVENPLFDFRDFLKYLVEPCEIELEEPERSIVAAMPRLGVEAFVANALGAARSFAATSVPVSITDNSLIGSPLLLMRLGFDLEADRVGTFIRSLFEAVRPLDPCIAWLVKPSLDQVMAEIDTGRPGHGEWVARLIAGSPHARRRGIAPTREGLRIILGELVELAADIVADVPVRRAKFPSGGDVWQRGEDVIDSLYAWVVASDAVR